MTKETNYPIHEWEDAARKILAEKNVDNEWRVSEITALCWLVANSVGTRRDNKNQTTNV